MPALADVKAGVDAWIAGDYAAAVREWRELAAQGDPDAQFNLAQAYRLGRGVEADPAQAEVLYARAAAQGHLNAADNYGLMLFQDGRREAAMTYLTAASARGDPRAQYLIGLAHFNGDLLPKDWVRAYALLTLSNAAGLPQAAAAIKQMDGFIPWEQRQEAQSQAQVLKREADAMRAAQLAAADLGADLGGAGLTADMPSQPSQPRAAVAAKSAVAQASRAVQSPDSPTATGGPWKVQLGAFSVSGNAEKLWRQLSSRGELAGKTRLMVPSGRLTRLLAGGYPSRDAADKACASLRRAGHGCLVAQ
ncbi:SPOR domain-containing protein [Allopontixanthobacter sp.]|uniref:SPOR domain-containing protein n=1 Tax=Allopontixanthobacter sp. TaxID=2906452 RepID=UPI002ABB9C8F|nr:SPOR domain-containing protein [Allopontixanthobacter sp.]MDZ4306474.1 SPOR domain-containing protein [Allopontixanthobacter sp.]